MGLKFLSNEWFEQIKVLVDEGGDLNTPVGLHDLVVNVRVTGTDWGDVQMSMNSGVLEKGHHPNAPTSISLPVDLAHRLFIDKDQSAGMEGFMSGQIKLDGDMSKLMIMQTVEPSAELRQLHEKIVAITSPK